MSQRKLGIAEAKKRKKYLEEKKEHKGITHEEYDEIERIRKFLVKQEPTNKEWW